jgi:hypothetical protein
MALVLCTGSDRALQMTRKMILEQGGHKVVIATGENEVREACKRADFDVVIVGQTVSRPQKQRFVNAARKLCSSAKVLELYTMATGRMLAEADDWLQVPLDVAPDLADRVTELAQRQAGKLV